MRKIDYVTINRAYEIRAEDLTGLPKERFASPLKNMFDKDVAIWMNPRTKTWMLPNTAIAFWMPCS